MAVATQSKKSLREIHLASTQGFCAGVSNAVEVVNLAIKKHGTPLFVRHQIVHNTTVIKEFETRGVRFVESLNEIPDHSLVIFSAHGTAPEEYIKANKRGIRIIDAVCPLVSKVHRAAVKFSEQGVQTVLIAHRGHQEMIGTSGYVKKNLLHIVENVNDVKKLNLDTDKPIGYLTQTTLSVDDTSEIIKALKDRYPSLLGQPKADICYATQNRQDAVKELAKFCDVVIVCGSKNSSNSTRLRETASAMSVDTYMIDNYQELAIKWLYGKEKLGITSGASVPRKVIQDLLQCIRDNFPEVSIYEKDSLEKDIRFPMPEV